MAEISPRSGVTATAAQPVSFISWRSIIAGALISQVFFVLLMALGMAVTGMSLDFGDSVATYGWGSAMWFIASAAIALFVGCYLAGRISNYKSNFVGSVEGLTVSAVFFSIFALQAGFTGGLVGSGVANTLGGASSVAGNLMQSPETQNLIHQTLQEANIETQRIPEVAGGVLTHLLNGNTEQAVNYLSAETGISTQEANNMINQWEPEIRTQLESLTEAAATTLASIGWMIFLMVGLGLAAGAVGGAFGSRRNNKSPLVEREYEVTPLDRASGL